MDRAKDSIHPQGKENYCSVCNKKYEGYKVKERVALEKIDADRARIRAELKREHFKDARKEVEQRVEVKSEPQKTTDKVNAMRAGTVDVKGAVVDKDGIDET
jgi:hypothetical protein